MLKAKEAALYFLKKDKSGSTFSAESTRLNSYLHLAQLIYIAKTGSPLIDAEYYAYRDGAVIPEIQENYQELLQIAHFQPSGRYR